MSDPTDFPFGANVQNVPSVPDPAEQELPFDEPEKAAPSADAVQKAPEGPQKAEEAPEAATGDEKAPKSRKAPQKPRKARSRKNAEEFGFFIFIEDLQTPEGQQAHKYRRKLKSTTVKDARKELASIVQKEGEAFADKKVTLVNFIESHETRQQLVTKLV